jgi:GDP-mannose 6-dehydrogenase
LKISIFGLGYVGCVSLGCLAQNGHHVVGVDVSQNKIDQINNGKPTIIEKGIDEIISQAHAQGRISATKDFMDAVLNSEISIVSVGTPSTDEGHLNLEYIYKVAQEIGQGIAQKKDFHIVAVRSTVLPGTNRKIGEIIENASGKYRNKDFAVVSNPEFLREGSAIQDYFHPPVTVLGADNSEAMEKLALLYSDLPAPVEKVPIEVAELIKYVNNTWHALKVSFANEIGNICKSLKIDSHQVMDLFAKDAKLNLSSYYLKPGFAYGGSCLPKDQKGLQTIAHDFYLSSPIIESIQNSNNHQKQVAIKLIEKHGKKRVGILGFSFKEGTDDLRYSPIVEVAEYLLGKGYMLKIYDKNVSVSKLTGTNKEFIDKHIPHLSNLISDDMEQVIRDSELVVITHQIEGAADFMPEYPEKFFVDLARVTDERFDNYEGICW